MLPPDDMVGRRAGYKVDLQRHTGEAAQAREAAAAAAAGEELEDEAEAEMMEPVQESDQGPGMQTDADITAATIEGDQALLDKVPLKNHPRYTCLTMKAYESSLQHSRLCFAIALQSYPQSASTCTHTS